MAAIYDKEKLFSEHWLLSCLSEPEADRVIQYSRIDHYPANKELFREGEEGNNMMAVLGGRVKMSSRSNDGKEVTLNIIGPGGVFGEMALLTKDNRSATALTLEDCVVLVLERRDFIPLLERNSKLCIKLMEYLCHKIVKTSEQVEDAVFLDRPAKLAKALLRLAKEFGEKTPQGTRIDLKLSQRNLGNLVGLTRESMNKQLAEWREQNIVRLDDGVITLQNIDALEDISDPL